MRAWPLIGAAALALCCASTGRPELSPLDPARIRSIERGVTTQPEIDGWFGPPTELEVRSSGTTLWRYERRWLELEHPGAVREALCASVGRVPVIQIPVLWFADCREFVRSEKLELEFTPEQIVLAFELSEDIVAAESVILRRVPYPYPYPVPIPLDPVADAPRR